MENNYTPDFAYLQQTPIRPELNQIKQDIQTKNPVPQNSNMGSGVSTIPSTFDLANSQTDNRVKAYDNTTPYLDVYKPISNGEAVAMYDTYIPRTDNNERLAQEQTTGEQWANGTTKWLTKTGTAIVGGTLGLVYGLGAALNEGSWSAIYDNDFSNKLHDLDTKMNYQLPNLYTKQEQEKGLGGQIFTSNFWADKFLGGLAFTAGAIVSEGIWAYATGGTSLATAGARLTARWGLRAGVEAGELAAGVTKFQSIYRGILDGAVEAGKISKTAAIRVGKTGEFLGSVGQLARSAGYEASVESLQYKKEATENFYATFADKNGREPDAQDIANFETELVKGANGVFVTNMAILMPSNLVTMGHILDIKSPIKTGIGEFIDRKAFGYGFDKATGKVLQASTKQKIARNVFDYGIKPGVTEGLFEEGFQGVTTKFANKWVEHTYDPKNITQTFQTTDALAKSIAEQYTSKDGIVEVGLGVLIGMVGGSVNVRSEQRAKEDELNYKEAVHNTFNEKTLQSILLPSKIQTANRIAGFSEEAKVEEQKGNIVRSAFAKKSATLSFINAEQVTGNSIEDTTQKMAVALNAISIEQWKDAGVSASQIEQHKEETLKEFSTLAQEWKTNKTYWQYMIGKKLVGEQNLKTTDLETVTGTQFNKNAQIIEALAWQSTIGETGNKIMSDIQGKTAEELGQEHATTLTTISSLRRQTANRRGQITRATKEHSLLLEQRDKLTKEITKLNSAPKETEGDKVRGTQLGERNIRLLEVNERINSLSEKIKIFAQEIGTADNYAQSLGDIDFSSQNIGGSTITGQDLISLSKNVKKFQDVITSLEGSNPQRAQYINDLLEEYGDAEDVFLQSQVTQKIINNPDFKFENIGGWLSSKFKGKKAMNENTQEWLQNAIDAYSKGKAVTLNDGLQEDDSISDEEYNDFVDNGVVSEERLDNIAQKTKSKEKLNERETAIFTEKTEEINEILRKEKITTKPKVEEPKAPVDTRTPLQKYKDRIEALLKKEYHNLTYIGENYDGVANKKPTEAEIEELRSTKKGSKRYNELRQKLSDWKVLDSAVDEDYNSIAQLINLIEQLDTEVEREDTKTEVTLEDIDVIKDDVSEDKDGGTTTVDDYTLAQNVQGSATIKKAKGTNKYRLSHLKVATIVGRLGREFTVKRKGKEITPDLDKLQPNDIIYVDDMSITYLAGGKIEISVDDFNARQQTLNLYVYDSGLNWSYKNLYTIKGDDFVKVGSDFAEDIDSQEIYNQQQGDKLQLVIDDQDGFNQTKFGGTKEQLKIYVVDSNGKKISVLKALRDGVINEDFLLIRDEAFKRWEDAGRPQKLNLGIELETDHIFLGSPEITLDSDGKPTNISITEKGATQVVATGYIEDGEVTLNREIKDVNKTFVGKLSRSNSGKKIPIVIIKKGAYNIVYPISMIKSSSPQTDLFDGILNSAISPQEKIIKINDEIQKQRIQTDKLVYSDINDQEKLDKTREAFEQKKSFVDAKTLSEKNYKINNLTKDAQINIDLENLDRAISDGKIRMSFENMVYKTDRDLKNESLVEVENTLNDLAIEAYQDFVKNAETKYVKANGDILEDTTYTNAFDDNEVVSETDSNLDKIANINVLSEAFSQKLPKIVEEALGIKKVNEIKKLLKQYKFIKSQIAISDEILKSGKDNTNC